MKIEEKSYIVDIILTLLTAGLWNLWVQYRQIRDINRVIDPHARIMNFWLTMFFSLITAGVYFAYHEYSLSKKLHVMVLGRRHFELEILLGLITFFGLWFITDSYQQHLLNQYSYQKRYA